jgi:undecaprenyl-diphosphatase
VLESIRAALLHFDLWVWHYLNNEWHNDLLDGIIPFFRNQYFWIPLYLFLLVFMPLHYRKRGWIWCFGFVIAFALADKISAGMIKPLFARVRPCNTPQLQSVVHLIVECGSGLSFPSSHATNHFAMGSFMAATIGRSYRWVAYASIFWAALISYSQVYVGVHFPLDVLCGGLLGATIGLFIASLFNRRVGRLERL